MTTALHGRASVADLGDMELQATVEMGRTTLPVSQARQLREGDVVALQTLAGENLAVRLNGHHFADGEVLVQNEWLCCRIIHLVEPLEARRESTEMTQ